MITHNFEAEKFEKVPKNTTFWVETDESRPLVVMRF